jgi:hypothetical protein
MLELPVIAFAANAFPTLSFESLDDVDAAHVVYTYTTRYSASSRGSHRSTDDWAVSADHISERPCSRPKPAATAQGALCVSVRSPWAHAGELDRENVDAESAAMPDVTQLGTKATTY